MNTIYGVSSWRNLNIDAIFRFMTDQGWVSLQDFPKFSVDSHAFPWQLPFIETSGPAFGAANDPANQNKSRFHTGFPHFELRSGARASRHPPRWRAQLDYPGNGTRAADRTVAAVRSAVFHFGGKLKGLRDSGSEVQRRRPPQGGHEGQGFDPGLFSPCA